jgi:hypothetical protein
MLHHESFCAKCHILYKQFYENMDPKLASGSHLHKFLNALALGLKFAGTKDKHIDE